MSTRPNIILVVLDTARASAFEPWGAPSGSTPTIGQLASKGTAVNQAVATCNWTLPSHAAMFTGCLPRAVGLSDAPSGHTGGVRLILEANKQRLLPEVLRRAGYATSAASANAWISRAHGFDTGFDTFLDVRGGRHTGLDKRDLKSRLAWMYQALVARIDDGANDAFDAARGWLDERGNQPFFWFFNLVECHSPYLPPRPWNDLGTLDRLRASREARRHLTLDAIWRTTAKREAIPDAAVGRMRHLYQRSVSLMDAWLGRLMTMLDERGVLDDTWLVVTSDHGENLGDNGLLGHAFSLDHRLLHVPLVVSGPDGVELPAFYSTIGLPGLIGELAGLAANPWTRQRQVADDVAIAQYDAIVPPDDPRLDKLTGMWDLDADARDIFAQEMTAATDGHRKLVRHGTKLRLYDLDRDPAEVAPVDITDPARDGVGDLWDAIRRADATDADPELIAAITASASGEMDEDLAAQMRLLGYL